ncbi:hypothetical protein [Paenibacillus wynnii]|uniref:hypothetical protein n=1 Tax=Paenibacillus wynnii TaxID=268407 RepID=UPI00278CA644|nr:hypothetical protein [Paenibacillus wynnii]MDQ0194705.1 hypothetical protein [Paenibacillus wynnii]
MRLFQIDQRLEYPLSVLQAGPFAIRYTYARSRETQQGDDIGQDYLTYKVTNDGIMFCVCDGVSQSYYGNLAAKYLGDALLQFMSESDCFNSMDSEYVKYRLCSSLQRMTAQATAMINRHEIPTHIGGLFREVLEEKRMKGSETTFVCGKIIYSAAQKKGQITAACLGDTGIRLFDYGTEIPGLLTGEISHWNRWSSCDGVLGEGPSILTVSLERDASGPNCIQVFTDGLMGYKKWRRPPDDAELRQMIHTSHDHAASDDVSFLEISWNEVTGGFKR